MKKIITLALALVMCFGCIAMFASCGKTEGTLVCGVTIFEKMNEKDENGNWTGFESEFAMEVGKIIGMDVQFQEIEWAQKYNELNSGAIDCVWNGFTANSSDTIEGVDVKRSDLVDFSYGYMLNQQCIVVKKANLDSYKSAADLAGKKAGVENGSAGESYAAGVVGETGRGVTELHNLRGEVEIITGTLGKAFGGAVGGFTTGKKEIIDLLRQRSRPYLFSNSLPPMVVAAGIKMFQMMEETNELQDKLHANTDYFREKMLAAGFDIKPTQSAICAVMLYDAKLSQQMAARLQEEGIYVTGFFYPVVPKNEARIRVQLSAAHEQEHLDKAIAAFTKIGKELGVIK